MNRVKMFFFFFDVLEIHDKLRFYLNVKIIRIIKECNVMRMCSICEYMYVLLY